MKRQLNSSRRDRVMPFKGVSPYFCSGNMWCTMIVIYLVRKGRYASYSTIVWYL